MSWIWSAASIGDTRNLVKLEGERVGRLFFPLKELLVEAGWTVKGSGDGNSRFAFEGTAAVPVEEQGSGGQFDVWLEDTGADGGNGNASHADAWCVLRAPGDRELLLVVTGQAGAGFDGFGRVFWSDQDGYVGDGAAAVIPTNPGDEQFIFGNRASSDGVELIPETGDAYVHVAAFQGSPNNEGSFWWATVTSGGVRHQLMALVPFLNSPGWSTSKYGIYTAADGLSYATWESRGLPAERWFTTPDFVDKQALGGTVYWGDQSNDDPVSGGVVMGDVVLLGQSGVADEEYLRGVPFDLLVRSVAQDSLATPADYPNLTPPDGQAITWMCWNRIALPWHRGIGAPPPLGAASSQVNTVFLRFMEPAFSQPPSVGNFDPEAGTPVAEDQPITFDVTDPEADLALIIVAAKFEVSGVEEIVHNGEEWNGGYVLTSERVVIPSGIQYTVLRTAGWPEPSVTLRVYVVDSRGNVA